MHMYGSDASTSADDEIGMATADGGDGDKAARRKRWRSWDWLLFFIDHAVHACFVRPIVIIEYY